MATALRKALNYRTPTNKCVNGSSRKRKGEGGRVRRETQPVKQTLAKALDNAAKLPCAPPPLPHVIDETLALTWFCLRLHYI